MPNPKTCLKVFLSLMDNDQEGENKVRLPKKVFSFVEIYDMGKARVWKDAIIA